MSKQYKCDKCGYVYDMSDVMCSECGDGYLKPLRWTTGGDGSHWEGCADVHLDCKIAQLEAELARLKEVTKGVDLLVKDHQAELARRDALIERLVEVGNDIVEEAQVQEPDVQELRDNWRVLIAEWKASKDGGGE